MSDIKNAILQKKIEGVLYDLMVKTNSVNVIMGDGRTLAETLADYLTSTQVTEQVNQRIDAIVGGAPAAFDTLKEIADYIATHEDVYAALNAAVGNKVDKVAGKGLSAEDFTTALKTKLEGLANYTHPSTHSADMIVETTDKNFVTAAEKTKIAASGRILSGASAPADMTENDLFFQIVQ